MNYECAEMGDVKHRKQLLDNKLHCTFNLERSKEIK